MAPNKKVCASLGHIGIEVSSVSKVKKFYYCLAGALGMKRVDETKGVVGWTAMISRYGLESP